MNIRILTLIVVAFSFVFGLGFLFFNTPQSSDVYTEHALSSNNTNINEKERNKELMRGISRVEGTTRVLRDIANNNASLINSRNCRGFLEDIDADGFFDFPVMGFTIQTDDSTLKILYNFCSFTYNTQEAISLIVTTQGLLDNFITEDNFGDRFVPAFVFKEYKDYSSDKLLTEENVGLINLKDLLVN